MRDIECQGAWGGCSCRDCRTPVRKSRRELFEEVFEESRRVRRALAVELCVREEIRAAELLALAMDEGCDPDDHMTIQEFNGWEAFRLGHDRTITDDMAAGYLGAVLTWHHGIIDGYKTLVADGLLPGRPEGE